MILRLFATLLLSLMTIAAQAELRMVDDTGNTIVLAQPARRIVSLAPSVTEMLFEVGAGDRIVGTIAYSDYPEAAKRIPRVGSGVQLDLERIVQLKPDVIVVWLHGSVQRQLDALRNVGIPVYYSEPRSLAAIAGSLRELARLAGAPSAGEEAAKALEARVAALRKEYSGRRPVRVFFQIWAKPVMTVNDKHLISDVLRTCGGENVFGSLRPLVPVLEREAVLAAAPEAIGTAVHPDQPDDGQDQWRRWPQLSANAQGNYFKVSADLIARHGPRIVDAISVVCEGIDRIRIKKP